MSAAQAPPDAVLLAGPTASGKSDWARALAVIGIAELDVAAVNATIGCILKSHTDLQSARALDLGQKVADARRAARLSSEASAHSTA